MRSLPSVNNEVPNMMDDFDSPILTHNRRIAITRRPYVLITAAILLVIVVMLVITIYLAVSRGKSSTAAENVSVTPLPCPLTYFNITDGLDVRWYPRAHTEMELSQALAGGYHMIQADVTFSSTLNTAVVGHSNFSLTEWIDKIISSPLPSTKMAGIKLDITSDKVVKPALDVLVSRHKSLVGPLVLAGNVLSTRDVDGSHLQREGFLQNISTHFPQASIGLGVDINCCEESYGVGEMEALSNIVDTIPQPVYIDIRVGLVQKSEEELRWILNKSNKLRMIIWSDKDLDGVDDMKLLEIRNDLDSNKILYNMKGSNFSEFTQTAIYAGSPLAHFHIRPRDAGKIIWMHAVNDPIRLKEALDGPTMMLEADILLDGQGTQNQTTVPIMAHPPHIHSNLTFRNWSDAVIPSGKGMKLDFKSLGAVPVALDILKDNISKINAPVWINADILQGPNGGNVTMKPKEFLGSVLNFPKATLSLGWTTGARGNNTDLMYTMEMVKQMNTICKELPQPVTFPVRAEITRKSLPVFDWLLKQSRGYTLTVWTSLTDDVTREDMNFVSRHTEAARVYFDLPDKWMPDISA